MLASSPARADSSTMGTLRSASSARISASGREAVTPRHHDVGDDQIGAVPARRRERLIAISDSLDRIDRRQQIAHVGAHIGVIVRQDDPGAKGRREAPIEHRRRGIGQGRKVDVALLTAPGNQRSASCTKACAPATEVPALRGALMRSAGRCSAPNGNCTENVVPRPSVLVTSIVPPWNFDQFLHQRQADAGALVGARRGCPRPDRSARTAAPAPAPILRYRYRPLPAPHTPLAAQSQRDLALKRELESVGEQIEYDLFPHFTIDIDQLAQILALDRQLQAGALDRRAKGARQIARERRQIGGLIAGLHAPGFDAREVEQRVDQLAAIAASYVAPAAAARRSCDGRRGSARVSSTGPSISVSGVRNS